MAVSHCGSDTGFQNEPAILRKKKPLPLMTTSTTKMFDEEIVVPDDYMLLGSQEKFSSNVPYRDYLTKNRTRVLGTTYVVSFFHPLYYFILIHVMLFISLELDPTFTLR